MRALLDYHHADLVESLHLLLEDRLGIECYIPVGMGWWERWYWGFGRATWGDDRLAQQFLTRANVERDDAHPQRLHRVIEVEKALGLPWDYVVASVPDNYNGYRAFAEKTGAKLVIQVGNTNQEVAWQYDPLVLNSSEMPIRGRGIQYHQEFDLDVFRYREPQGTRQIASFVNCMDRLPCYPDMLAARELLPDFEWRVHGIDGPDGNIKPTARIADLMAEAGWGWHDKVTGDGFGHVIHNWAAVGRPLIGHGSHYAGKVAAPFWEDGVTCIDLDRHSLEEACQMVRDTSAEQHAEMCRAIRARFDACVDYAAEAEQIRALLA